MKYILRPSYAYPNEWYCFSNSLRFFIRLSHFREDILHYVLK